MERGGRGTSQSGPHGLRRVLRPGARPASPAGAQGGPRALQGGLEERGGPASPPGPGAGPLHGRYFLSVHKIREAFERGGKRARDLRYDFSLACTYPVLLESR